MNEQVTNQSKMFKNVLVICPECKTQKFLKVPSKILIQSQNVVTVSIPTKTICDHHFQVFVDKNGDVRGYQRVDFEFPTVEYYENRGITGLVDESRGIAGLVEDLKSLTTLPLFQDIIAILRGSVDNREILGSAIFTVEGSVLYTSISHDTLLNTIRELEVRDEKKLHSISKMFLELRNREKVCAEYIKIIDKEFILVIVCSRIVNFGIGNVYLQRIIQGIRNLTN
ncbi:MAG: hypothetical protein ACFFBI_04750 [Promethearchaeota archaeon]